MTVARATALAEAGATTRAVALLAGLLGPLDPATAGLDHRVISAAVLYARIVEPVPGLVPVDVAWARYAHRAARVRYGPDHPCTIDATETLALVLFGHSRYDESNSLRRHLIQLHLDRGDLDAHLSARMDLAVQLHEVGRCGDAIREATDTWQLWTSRHSPADPASMPLALHLTAMLVGCGRTEEAAAVTATAELRLPSADDATRSARDAFLAVLDADGLHHRPICARNLDHILGVAVSATGPRDHPS